MARFIAQGAFHKIVDIVEGVSVAVMAFSLATSTQDYLSQSVRVIGLLCKDF